MYRLRHASLFLVLALAGALNAHAQDGAQYNVAITSNYVFRGISQSDNHPALQGGVDYKDAGGLYVGLWGTTQDIPNTRVNVRADGYAGFAYQSSNGLGFDLGARAYSNAFVRPAQKRDSFWEMYGALNFGPAMIKLSHDFHNHDTYAEGSVNYDLGSGVTLGVHAGHYFLRSARLGDDYSDFGVSVGKLFNQLEATLAVTDTTQDPSTNLNDATVILTGKYLF